MRCEILIQNGSTVYIPSAEDGIEWSLQRKGTPGKLVFKAVQDGILDIQEGNAVQLRIDGEPAFCGYVFGKSYDKEKSISVTCYDQLRYLKNKDSYVYVGKKADEVLHMICNDFMLIKGEIEDTGYCIPRKAESNKTLFDIIQDALDTTLINTGKLYVLYDDCGKITLKDIESMKLPLLIDAETGQNYDYSSSIDTNTYNVIKLTPEDEKVNGGTPYLKRDMENIRKWGILQYTDTLKEGENPEAKADALLNLYNQKTRNIKINDAWGDIRLRAGSQPRIRLDLGDIFVDYPMVCEKVTHKFKNNEHTMDITLIGGEFVG